MVDAAPARILIILMGAIGDVARALPLLCRLKSAYQRTQFYWAVEPAAAPLLEGHPALDGMVVYHRSGGAPAFVRFLRQVRKHRVDWALDLQRHLKSGVVGVISGANRRIGFHRTNSREANFLFQTEHLEAMPHLSSKLRQFLRFADHVGVPEAPLAFGLNLAPEEESRTADLLAGVHRPFAALPVGSTAPSRLWFPDRTAAVVQMLEERGLSTVLLGAPQERHRAREIRAAGAGHAHDLVGRTSLRDVVGILSRARVVVGPDCGPMHIAAAVGTPVVSLWGATSAARSAPYGSEDLVVEGEAPCRPCYLKSCPIGRLCMEAISPRAVIEHVDAALGRERP